jgi:hypothetical protein
MWNRTMIARTAWAIGLAASLTSCASGLSAQVGQAPTRASAPPRVSTISEADKFAAAKKVCATYYESVKDMNEISDDFWKNSPSNLNFGDVDFMGGTVIDMVTVQRKWEMQIEDGLKSPVPHDLKDALINYLEKDRADIVSFFGDQTIKNLSKADSDVGDAGKDASDRCRPYK